MTFVIHAQLDSDEAKAQEAKKIVKQYDQEKFLIIYETPNVPFHIVYEDKTFFKLQELSHFLKEKYYG